MKILLDFLPLILFVYILKNYDIFTATYVLIGALFVQFIVNSIIKRKIEYSHLIALIIATFLGGATLYYQDESFIKLKTTIVYALFAFILTARDLFAKTNFAELTLGRELSLPKNVWKKINYMWVTFFSFMAVLNLYVAKNYTTEEWGDFKGYGVIGLTLCFVFIQALYLAKYLPKTSIKKGDTTK